MMNRLVNTAVIAATTAPLAPAAVIGIDARAGSTEGWSFAHSVNHQTMRSLIESQGHSLVFINQWNAATLAGVDAVLMREASRSGEAYSASEAAAIEAYNLAGGGVGFFADGGWSSNTLVGSNNLIANVLGAEMAGVATHRDGLLVTGFVPGPIFDGIVSWGADFVRAVTPAGPNPATDLTTAGDPYDIFVSRDGISGGGNAVVVGDATWLTNGATADYDINSLQNAQLFLNTVEYLLIPAPAAAWPLLALGFTRRRRA